MAVLRHEYVAHFWDASILGSALFLSAAVLCTVLGLKLKWFRASINFDHPPSSMNNIVVNKNDGVYRPFQNNELAFGNQSIRVAIPTTNKRLDPSMVKLPPSKNSTAQLSPAAGQSTSSTPPVPRTLQSALKKSNGTTDKAPSKSTITPPPPQLKRPDSLPLKETTHPVQPQAARPFTKPLSQPKPPPQQTLKVTQPSPEETPQLVQSNNQKKLAIPGSSRPKSLFSFGSSNKLSVAEKKQEKELRKMEAQRLKEAKESEKLQQKQTILKQKNQSKNKGAKAESVPIERPYSTGTIGSTVSTSTAPPPYSETMPKLDIASNNLKANVNNATGNTSYGERVPEASSWDMVYQHRKQMQKPVGGTTIGDNKDFNGKRESRFEYNVGRSPFLPHIEHEGKTEV